MSPNASKIKSAFKYVSGKRSGGDVNSSTDEGAPNSDSQPQTKKKGRKLMGKGGTTRGTKGFRRKRLQPIEGEQPIVMLRVQVVGCKELLAKDKSGFSDPFLHVTLIPTRHTTPVVKRTLNPSYPAKDSTFDFPIYLSLADRLGVLELVVWDKDLLKKDYLGEGGVLVSDWFKEGQKLQWDPESDVISIPLVSSRSNTPDQGSVQLRMGFTAPPGGTVFSSKATESEEDAFREVYHELVRRSNSRPSLVNGPATEGVGTVRSRQSDALGHASIHGDGFEDDGGLSSESEDEGDDVTDTETEDDEVEEGEEGSEEEEDPEMLVTPTASPAVTEDLTITPTMSSTSSSFVGKVPSSFSSLYTPSSPSSPGEGARAPPPPKLNLTPASPGSKQSASPLPSPVLQTAPAASAPSPKAPKGILPRMFPRRSMSTSSSPTVPSPVEQATFDLTEDVQGTKTSPQSSSAEEKEKKSRFRKSWGTGKRSASGSSEQGSEIVSPKPISLASGGRSVSTSPSIPSAPATPPPAVNQDPASKKRRPGLKKRGDRGAYSFAGSSNNDIVGIVMLEIQNASDLPKLRNMTRTGWDMDPFVVISFGKKVFRTRVIRHSLNPVWDEKLLFHVRRYETTFKVQLSVLDWDKISSNDYICDTMFDVKDLIEQAPQPNPETGLYPLDEDSQKSEMVDFELPLKTGKEMGWEVKHKPIIKFKAKYQPYAALRQRFWHQYLKQYDTDDTRSLAHLEITSMLDSLGSTLTNATVNSFFTRFNKDPLKDELTFEEAIHCLETELGRPDSEKKRLDQDHPEDTSVSATPVLMASDGRGNELALDQLNFSGPPLKHMTEGEGDVPAPAPHPTTHSQEGSWSPSDAASTPATEYNESGSSTAKKQVTYSSSSTSEAEEDSPGSSPWTSGTNELTVPQTTPKTRKSKFRRNKKKNASASSSLTNLPDDTVERVINVKNCPLCHRPRLNSKAEVDIVTHLAVCASQDWNKVDRIVVGNFVTASQAQRKWYTKIISKVSSGDYKLGANSANIIVQNRMTGQLEEEKMQVYVRLGIRLLYKGMKGRMEGGRARRLLKSLSIKQGIKYDDPESARDIPAFIQFHGLNMDEVLEPLENFKTFNQFFYRKLKPSARPAEKPDDPYRLVSAADCRFMAFESVSEATRLWIKGREFTVARLLGDKYKDQADRYNGGAVCIFRLAPQDYHRFHSPVDGTIGPMTYIAGEYYTVNPQAIRTALDVYGENARKIVPIDSPQFGRVMAVCIGAMMVGSIITTVEEGQTVKRGEEFGYFAFGGSTIVVLFESGVVEWDEDLLINGRASLETLVRVGMGIGNSSKKQAAE
ncbi:hypothetical protein K435DRAFT_774272 [Dendrothele bispora CBS 962.96]|uniref:Phosphatidylserine decarboxylase proenzyme 2 n=1 Tax=Dendrothele bispora (strain CBS 962.96) TaxID=1314807 RepID=A0A4S8MP04_DENBC|nr:hypothetical protein K435DRAFT_774272 [Dendrothele bispora CBS 962.96]